MKTSRRIEKEERDARIYRAYVAMKKRADAMPTAIEARIMEKYGIGSRSTVWRIIDRAKKRMGLCKS